MRPTDLKYPFIGQTEKTVLLKDRVLFVPEKGVQNYASFQFKRWEEEVIFGNSQPVMIEYCSGNGAWIAAKALEFPQYNWVAVEKKFDRVRKIWSKMQNFQLKNLLIIYGEANFVTKTYFPSQSVSSIYINFPDPWPKRRHARFRLINPEFIEVMRGSLKDKGDITVATDDIGYSQSIIKDFCKNPLFMSHYADPFYTEDYPNYGSSYFEELWRGQGLSIRYHRFAKTG